MRRSRSVSRAAAERLFDELISLFRRKSFSVKLELHVHTKILSGTKNYRDFQEFLFLKIKPKMRDVLKKMRECGK